MAKPIKFKDLKVGMLIVRGEHADAQVYTIAARDSLSILEVKLIWFEGTRLCSQWTDYSDCYTPTIAQIEHSIAANGRLASRYDVLDILAIT